MPECIQEESFCPTVSFSKITLEEGSSAGSISKRSALKSNITTTRTPPQVQLFAAIDSYRQIEPGLVVTVDAAIREIDSGGLLTGWLNDELLGKYLKVKIIQSTKSGTTEAIINWLDEPNTPVMTALSMAEAPIGRRTGYRPNVSNKPSNPIDVKLSTLNLKQRFFSTKEISITDILKEREGTQFRTIDSDGNTAWNIPFKFQFNIDDTSNHEHLTYFIFSYYDFTDADFGIDLPDSLRKVSGRVEYRKVVDNFEIHGIAGSGGDTVIQDFRRVKRLEGLQLLPDLSENKFLSRTHRINILTNDNMDIVRNSAYFSDFFVTRDNIGNARFFFSLDFRKLILENTVFGKYFSNVSERMFNNIVNNTIIRSLKVKRRRVVPLPGTNKLGGTSISEKIFDKNTTEETIAVFPSTISTDLGTIRETKVVNREPRAYKHIRHFTGVDFDVSKQTYGHFQYGIELEIEDRSIDLLVNRYNRLLREKSGSPVLSTGGLDEYINILNIPNVYNLPNLDLEKEWEDKVVPAIQVYFEIVDDLFVRGNKHLISQFRGARSLVKRVTHPSAKDPRGVLLFSKLVNNVLQELESLINISSNRMVSSSSDRSSTASNVGSKPMKTFKVEKYFAELFDSDTPKNVGFDYLSTSKFATSRAAATGLEIIGLNVFRERLNTEMLKYYKNVDDNISLTSDVNTPVVSLNTMILTTPIHLSPSIAVLGNKQYSFNNQEVDLWNKEINDLCATKILSYKSTGGLYNSKYETKTTSKLKPAKQKIKYNLLKTLEAFNLTMVEPSLIYEKKDKEEDRFINTGDVLKAATAPAEVQTKPYKEEIMDPNESQNPNLFLAKLVSGFALTIPPAPMSRVFIGDQGESIPNPQQRLGNAERFTIEKLLELAGVATDPKKARTRAINERIIEAMPLQLKSILADAAGYNDKVNHNFQNLSTNLATENAFIFNYLLLQKVEFLSGYVKSTEDGVLIKRPVWRTATMQQLRDFKNTEILCRLRRFEHQNLPSVRAGEGLDIPSYDNYFIIQKTQALEEAGTATRERDRLIPPGSDELPIVEEFAAPQSVGDLTEGVGGTTGGALGGGGSAGSMGSMGTY